MHFAPGESHAGHANLSVDVLPDLVFSLALARSFLRTCLKSVILSGANAKASLWENLWLTPSRDSSVAKGAPSE